jgi:uncharacterized protein involved in exopolysaccharide biosynthesis/LysM repeat protein
MVTPILLAGLVTYLTKKPNFKYASETRLYTGIASGSSVEQDKAFNYFASNTAFDNLISVIKSRETQQEVAIRLLAQHLLMTENDPHFISGSGLAELRKITPDYVKAMVVKTSVNEKIIENTPQSSNDTTELAPVVNEKTIQHKVAPNETLFTISQRYHIKVEQIKLVNGLKNNNIKEGQILTISNKSTLSKDARQNGTTVSESKPDSTFSFASLDSSSKNVSILPGSVTNEEFEQTVENLTGLMVSSDTNFVYKLLNFVHPHYSIDAISSLKVQRISNSDLVLMQFETDDPGVCMQTLELYTQVCVKNYKSFTENRSDAVVKYFDFQLKQAAARLKVAEDRLLDFNKDNNIINYYEQSKAVANVKEDLDVEYNNKRINLAGLLASIKQLEEKLGSQQQIQLSSSKIIDKRNELGELNYKIASIEIVGGNATKDVSKLADLKMQADQLKTEIKQAVNDLYRYENSINGLPVSTILTDWIAKVVEAENTKAGIEVLGERIKEFQKQYAIYAPAGANVKRIEREIAVSEAEFLEILHGLNLAKLKMQDNELASNIKAVDPAFFPLTPMPTKRKIVIIAAGFFGFMIVLVTIFVLEYFDETLKSPSKAAKILKLPALTVVPKILLRFRRINFLFILNRMLEIAIQKMELYFKSSHSENLTKTLVFFSTLNREGKSMILNNIAQKLKKQNKKILVLNYSRESLKKNEMNQIGYPENFHASAGSGKTKQKRRFSITNLLLGHPDNRIDYDSPFLESPEDTLNSDEYFLYNIDENHYSVKNYQEILALNDIYLPYKPDFVLIEIPAILFYPYPANLLSNADMPIMVCRANRVWSNADQGILDVLMQITSNKTHFVINGVELEEIEPILGDLPKKRSWLRRKFKKAVQFQFFSRNQL